MIFFGMEKIMYKPSKYNIILDKKDKFCVYNSLFGNIALITDNEVKRYLQSENINETNEKIKKLVNDGYVVKNTDDEDTIADIKRLDIISNKELYLVLLPTTGCNFRCNYCYENNPQEINNFSDNYMSLEIQNSIYKFAKRKLKESYGLFVEWYGGEPLLKIDIINNLSGKLIPLCQERGKPYYATLTTNGYLLTPEILQQCLKNHIYSFHVTVDGFNIIHDKFRILKNGAGTQSVIIDNLRNIRDNIRSKYFKIIFRTNISKELIPMLEDWIKFLYYEFGNDNRFQFFFRPVEDRGGEAIKSVKNSILMDMNEAYDIMINSEYKLDYSYIKPFMYNSICSAAKRNTFIIDPEGNIKKCGEYLNNPLSDIGRLDKEGYMDINRYALANWVKIRDMTYNSKCSICKSKASCFNMHCPMKVNLSCDGNHFVCGIENTYIEKVMDLLTEREYNFILKY